LGYSSVIQKGNVALATNGATVEGVARGGSCLLDGDSTNYDTAIGFADSPWPCEWIIRLKKTYRLSELRFRLWDKDPRFYRYAVAVSADGKKYVPLVERSQGEWRGWQQIQFSPRPVKAIKLIGLYNSANENFHVVEFEAYCIPTKH
ncbi:MAG: hypothetical protein ABSG53_25865, partial [Thermoguttaceae bacterium]